MLDIIGSYSPETIQMLRSLREQLLVELQKTEDPKKILSFLSKCAVIGITEEDKTVRIGVPNEFVVQQLKKFFHTKLQDALHEIYAPGYKIQYSTLAIFTDPTLHPLQLDLKKLLHIEDKPKTHLEKSVKEELTEYFGILFEKKYTFDNFVVGSNNQLAQAAAQAVAHEPGVVYNPLFIYGNVGLGKTHLMQAIGNQIIQDHPEKTVFYLPTSKFIDQVITAIRQNHLGRFMEQLTHIDVLMLDDIQFLAGKDKTQEIFHNIFNEFYSKNKQIVLTSDQPPKALTLLEARLQSRFALGLIVDIQVPDLETKQAILQMKLKSKGAVLDEEIVTFLATHISGNIRELEGALNILLTHQQLMNETPTLAHAQQALVKMGITKTGKQSEEHISTAESPTSGTMQTHEASADQIVSDVAVHFGVEPAAILGQLRTKAVSQARQLAMYLIKTKLGRSLQRIGDYFGGRNHASVIYAIQICEQDLSLQPQLRKFMQTLEK